MKALLDTNVFLEILLDQEQAASATTLLAEAGVHEFFLTDYALHSIGLLLFRRRLHQVFTDFVEDMLLGAGVRIATLPSEELSAVSEAARTYGLDFDDAYQYAVAKSLDLALVSFDADFDCTDLARRTPGQFLGGGAG
jgi:predicted nucleic acid-binding protein